MLYSSMDAFILNFGLFAGHLTHCKSFFTAEDCLIEENTGNNNFFVVNGDFSINFIALNKPGGGSK
jgi:hypothetical protein